MSGVARPYAVRAPEEFGKVAVLMGGDSSEREVSLMSGEAVLRALQDRKVDAHAVDSRDEVVLALQRGDFQRAWIVLHGEGGEDGRIQGALDILGIPYTGSDLAACALSMDKLRTKHLLLANGLRTPEYLVLTGDGDFPRAVSELGLPLIVKPSSQGSSVGMTKVERSEQLPGAFSEARRFDSCVLAETWIEGGEYTAAILSGSVLPLVRIETPNTFYDYQAKYFSDDTRYFCPAGLSEARELGYQETALAAFDALGAGGWGRVDFMVGKDGEPLILEVNTVPGMTSHSLVPMAAREAGLPFEELVWRILETSFRNDVGRSGG